MSREREICLVCGETRSAHVPTEKGPLTHPREARGEGEYIEASPAKSHPGYWPGEEFEVPARYVFRPFPRTKTT